MALDPRSRDKRCLAGEKLRFWAITCRATEARKRFVLTQSNYEVQFAPDSCGMLKQEIDLPRKLHCFLEVTGFHEELCRAKTEGHLPVLRPV
jgi:hypothetical protein